MNRMLPLLAAAAGSLLAAAAQAAAPGITGTGTAGTFNLTAQPAYISQPDGQAVYSWGYGCRTAPSTSNFVPASLSATVPQNLPAGLNLAGNALMTGGERDYRLAPAAYHVAQSCYDREYLFQFSEIDPNIHVQALAQVTARGACTAGAPGCSLNVPTEPYR